MDVKYTIEGRGRSQSRLVLKYAKKMDDDGRLVGDFDAEYVCSTGKRRANTMGSLLLVKNGVPEVKLSLGDLTVLGRSSECDIQLLDTQLSRQHVQIEKRDGDYWLEDLGSENGTYIGDGRVEEPYRLVSGDEIRIGGLSFIFDPIVDVLHQQDGDKAIYLVDEERDSSVPVEQLHQEDAELDREAILAIHRITCDIVATLDLEILLDSFLDRFMAYFKADRGFILLKHMRQNTFVPGAIRTSRNAIALSRSLMQRAIDSKSPILVHNALEDVSFVGAKSIIEHQLRSVMLVPLLSKDRVIGLLQIDKDTSDAFDQTSLAELDLLARSAALAIENARRYEQEKQKLGAESINRTGGVKFIGNHPSIEKLLADTDKAAASDARVLITGESGTGKELVATMIHQKSARSSGPFVAINCGALPDNLVESELFGHEKGAFTGATTKKRGAFELADGGTLFLDEIAELKVQMQAKLLRATQDNCFYRLGSERPTHVDIRIVAATNQDLPELVATGNFREDLYYRLNVVALVTPPLRERVDDIQLLADFFAVKLGRSLGKQPTISSAAMARLKAYPWPGNVRELKNVIERLLVLGDGKKITAQNLPLEMSVQSSGTPHASSDLHEVLAATERELIARALAETKGNKSAACRILGISRPTMDKKIIDYNIEN